MTIKGKGKTALLAKESKAEMAKNQTTQQIDMLRAMMKKARITEGELDSGVKLLEDAKAEAIKKDESTKLGKAIKVLEKLKELAEQIDKQKKDFQEVIGISKELSISPPIAKVVGSGDVVGILAAAIVFAKIIKKILKK
jgi:hypothetical protein